MGNKTKSGSEKIYQDKNGNDTSLWGMLETEPHWILNRFQLMERELENIKELSRWIPVKERLPDEGKCVLCYHPKWGRHVAKIWNGRFESAELFEKPTHWQPIPDPPKAE